MDFLAAREQMVTQQIRTWAVLDERVLAALREVPREDFVPEAYRHLAFADTHLPLSHSQVMLAPNLAGKILDALAIQPKDQVLLIGADGGHLAACLSLLAGKVRVMEYHPDLTEQARQNLRKTACNNLSIESGDATQLDLEQAYDVIILTGSLPVYDERYQRALKTGGRLFVVVGRQLPMEALRITRTAAQTWQRDSLFETELPALPNSETPAPFIF